MRVKVAFVFELEVVFVVEEVAVAVETEAEIVVGVWVERSTIQMALL